MMFLGALLPALTMLGSAAAIERTENPNETGADSVKSVLLKEVNVVSSPKENGALREQAASVSVIGKEQIAAAHQPSLKGISTLVPNFFMPDYGSRLTSAVYIRGIGSRIGTPAVGLYVDNVPYYDKSAFDFCMNDVERVDVLRGPQSTLYGRNTMGGLVKVHTKSPFSYSGTDVSLGYATKDNERRVALTHYHRVSDKFAFSAGGFYNAGDGFFNNTNAANGKHKVDDHQDVGGRIRAIYKPSQKVMLDMNVGYEYSDEGAYPYFYTGATNNKEEYSNLIGKISSNLDGNYRRGLFNAGVNAEVKGERVVFNSVTGYQNINDRMFMDQDFLAADIYSLEQKQRVNTISEELTWKSLKNKKWQWIVGGSAYYQWMNVKAPVVFRKDGVGMLNGYIAQGLSRSPMPVTVEIMGDEQAFLSDFETPMGGAALFHQSTFNDLFGAKGLSAIIGSRLDYERVSADYNTWYSLSHTYQMPPRIDETYELSNRLKGDLSDDYLQFLPKVALKYEFGDHSNVYASVSKGYRSGGYNVQSFSEPMRSTMQTDLMKNVRDVTLGKVPPQVAGMVQGVFDQIISDEPIDIEGSCAYKPEYTWSYEIGTHLNLFEGSMALDASAFVNDVRDLQLSQMSETWLGRTIVNAGRSRSLGGEVAVKAQCTENLAVMATYGYTYSTFRDYHDYDSDGKPVNCRGNRVPFMPDHTFNLDAAYTIPLSTLGNGFFTARSLTIGANYSGAGRIYWDELNTASQGFHSLLGARMSVEFSKMQLEVWGKNLTNKHYDTFWFESMNRGYAQHGRPLQIGVDLKFTL